MQTNDTETPGLVRGAMQPMDKADAQPSQAPQGGDDQARVLQAATTIIYNKATRGQIAKMLRGKDPMAALAQTVLFVLKILYDESLKAGGSGVPPQILMGAIPEIVKRLAEMAEAAGMQLTPEQIQQVEAMVTQRMQKRFAPQQPTEQQPTAAPQAGIMQQAMQGA